MPKSSTEKSQNLIWGLFSSVRLTIVLLIILAITSILGTIIPQQDDAISLAKQLNPGLFRLFQSLDLFDMYHSIWFRLLIGFLALNLVICSIDRFPNALRRFRAVPKPDRSKPFEHLPSEQAFLTEASLKEASATVARFLRSRYKNLHHKETQETSYFLGEKGRFSHFGVYLVHLSVLIILIGALLGSFFGFEAYVNILEGERIDAVALRKGGGPLKLGFEVACDKFTVDFYENGAPREYRSELRFFIEGKEAEKADLLVNHPFQFKGITFYQSSYGTVPGNKVSLRIAGPGLGPKGETMGVEADKPYDLPGGEGQFSVRDIRGDIMDLGPAILISVQPSDGKETHFWVFQNWEIVKKRLPPPMAKSTKFNPSAFKPYTFFLDGVKTKYYTGLQVNKDPGVPMVWLGCFAMVLGFLMTFFMSHRKTWVQVSEKRDEIKISVAGTANKDQVGLKRHLERLTNDLRNRLDERGK
ncbi:MAG: cytochrome c biogenesis protein ResB [Desulfobacteraceae bacterium]|nr:cytochrome c biogenesis protein ResB [Desulfobacteraceae bacterium]